MQGNDWCPCDLAISVNTKLTRASHTNALSGSVRQCIREHVARDLHTTRSRLKRTEQVCDAAFTSTRFNYSTAVVTSLCAGLLEYSEYSLTVLYHVIGLMLGEHTKYQRLSLR